MPFNMTYRSKSGRLTFSANVRDRYEAWNTLSVIQELFEEPGCGACGSENIRHSTRSHAGRDGQESTFYELVCNDCGAKLEYGVTRDGSRMWAKRTDKDKQPMANRGWFVYQRPAQQEQNQEPNRAPESYPQDGGDQGQYPQEPPQDTHIPF